MAVSESLEMRFTAVDRTRAAFGALRANLAKTESRAKRLRASFAGLAGGIGKLGSVIGLAGGVGLVGGLAAARREMGELDALSKQIKSSGLSSGLFQTLQVATEEASISQERLNAATLKFTAGIGELRGGFGTLETSLSRINPLLAEQLKMATSTDEAMLLFADAVKNAASQEEKLALVSAVTGKRAAELVRVFELGRDGFADTTKRAKELGLILGDDLLENAEALENRFGLAAFAIDRQFKVALSDLAPVIVATIEGFRNIVTGLGNIVTGVKDFFTRVRAERKAFFADTEAEKFKKNGLIDFDPDDFLKNFKTGTAAATVEVKKSTGAIGEWETTVKRSASAIRESEQRAQAFASTVTGAFQAATTGGQQLGDVLKNLLAQFASQALQSGLTKLFAGAAGGAGGGGGGFLAGLFGGAFASGGIAPGGKVSLVGERGPELIAPRNDARVVPLARGGGSSVTIIQNNDFSSGVTPADRAFIEARIAQSEQRLKGEIPSILSQGNQNDPNFGFA
jgi:methyl-accepting chemotaxis protein